MHWHVISKGLFPGTKSIVYSLTKPFHTFLSYTILSAYYSFNVLFLMQSHTHTLSIHLFLSLHTLFLSLNSLSYSLHESVFIHFSNMLILSQNIVTTNSFTPFFTLHKFLILSFLILSILLTAIIPSNKISICTAFILDFLFSSTPLSYNHAL